MTAIEKYYDLFHQLTVSNFRVEIYEKDQNEKTLLIEEVKLNSNLKEELETLKVELSEKIDVADTIRTALIHVASGVLNSFAQIEKWGNYYPDLNQGMVVQGYLFGKIITDFSIALKFEGGLPGIEIYMSKDKWDYESLKQLIANIKDELIKSRFETKMQAIEYYEHIRKLVLKIAERLRKESVI